MFTDAFLVLFTSEQSGWRDFAGVAVDGTGQQTLSELPDPLTLEIKPHCNLELTKFAKLTVDPAPRTILPPLPSAGLHMHSSISGF